MELVLKIKWFSRQKELRDGREQGMAKRDSERGRGRGVKGKKKGVGRCERGHSDRATESDLSIDRWRERQ